MTDEDFGGYFVTLGSKVKVTEVIELWPKFLKFNILPIEMTFLLILSLYEPK